MPDIDQLQALFKSVSERPPLAEDLELLAAYADDEAFLRLIDEGAVDEADPEFITSHRDWMARVFTAIGEAPRVSEEEQRRLDELIEAKRSGDRAVGDAFRTLVQGLPDQLLDWDARFGDLPMLEPDQQASLCRTPDVEVALPTCEPLLRRGITPLVVFYAALSVRALVDRRRRTGVATDEVQFKLVTDDANHEEGAGALSIREVLDEVVAMAECPRPVGERLLAWLMAVVDLRPLIFVGLEATRSAEGLLLDRLPGEITVGECWEEWDAESVTK